MFVFDTATSRDEHKNKNAIPVLQPRIKSTGLEKNYTPAPHPVYFKPHRSELQIHKMTPHGSHFKEKEKERVDAQIQPKGPLSKTCKTKEIK